ncbi:hypothetical protein HPP92_016058 [Vanilla planifolia]|uniref:Uncharacterized protein n=1 Tax=Vanilla planifolia TaxID=51239 RepID=A0A835QJA6_VANPL|nr:hypothetical protein HPP92_016667 [Vanilla planifolia]KAG0471512.1 hypothetical protein HPP92_016058 [Vanilla planifolia]
MASAYINNVRISPENFLDCLPAYPSHGWISPRASFGNDFAGNGEKNDDGEPEQGNVKDLEDFEFQIDDPVTMLPADELFSNGKLLPLHMAPIPPMEKALVEIRSPEPICSRRKVVNGENEVWSSLPKAPRCSSRLKELSD